MRNKSEKHFTGGETGPAVKVQAPCEGIIAFQGPGTGLFFGFRFPE